MAPKQSPSKAFAFGQFLDEFDEELDGEDAVHRSVDTEPIRTGLGGLRIGGPPKAPALGGLGGLRDAPPRLLGGLRGGGTGAAAPKIGGLVNRASPKASSVADDSSSKAFSDVAQILAGINENVDRIGKETVTALQEITKTVHGISERTMSEFDKISKVRGEATSEQPAPPVQESIDALVSNIDAAVAENDKVYIIVPGRETGVATQEEITELLKDKNVVIVGGVQALAKAALEE